MNSLLQRCAHVIRSREFFFPQNKFNIDVLWNICSLVILGLSGMILNSLIISKRGAEALGVFNEVFAFYIVASQLAVGGLQLSALKHCSYEQDNPATCALIASSALAIVAILSCSVCFCLYSLRDLIGNAFNSSSIASGLAYVIPGLFFFSLNKVLLMVLNGLRYMRAYAIFQAMRYIFILLGVVFIIFGGYSSSFLPLSLTVSETLLFFALMKYVNSSLFRLTFCCSDEMMIWYRRHIIFGSRGFLSGVFLEMNTRVDILLLGYFMSERTVGIFSFASIFAEGFAQLNMVIRQNVDPIVGRCFAEGNLQRIEEMSKKIRTTFFPCMVIAGGILVMSFPLLPWLLVSDPLKWQSWGVFTILVCGIVLSSAYQPFFGLLLQGGRPGMFTIFIACSVTANALLNLCLIPPLGIYGSAIATASVYVLQAVAILLSARKLFRIRL
jgi:O-antigen/teichoic acid export membrane protein